MRIQVSMISAALASLAMIQGAQAEAYRLISGDRPPYVNEKGTEAGFCVDLINEMAKRAGVEIKLEFMPWSRAQDYVAETPNTMLPCVSRSKDREDSYAWLAPMNEVSTLFMTVNKPVNSFDEAKALTVSVRGDTQQEKHLKEAGLTKLDLQEDLEISAKMLDAGRVDAWYTHDLRAFNVWKSLGLDVSKLVAGSKIKTEKQFLAGHKDIPAEVSTKLSEAMDAMVKDGTYGQIFAKYFGSAKPSM